MQQIVEAAGKRDIAAVTALTKRASELEQMKKTLLGIEERLRSLDEPAPGAMSQPAPKPPLPMNGHGLRELPVEVTQGMIRQNLLTLTEHVKRGRIQPGETLQVEVQPSGERFRTDLVVNGNKLRERGAVGRFYREAGVQAGDFVVLTETAAHTWTLQKAAPGQYQGRRSALTWQ
jgi:hypothetical protein